MQLVEFMIDDSKIRPNVLRSKVFCSSSWVLSTLINDRLVSLRLHSGGYARHTYSNKNLKYIIAAVGAPPEVIEQQQQPVISRSKVIFTHRRFISLITIRGHASSLLSVKFFSRLIVTVFVEH